jgi:hypothetical protein
MYRITASASNAKLELMMPFRSLLYVDNVILFVDIVTDIDHPSILHKEELAIEPIFPGQKNRKLN